MAPLTLKLDNDEGDVTGVNVIDINSAHQLLAFGTEVGVAQFWDPRSRTKVGTLKLPANELLPPSADLDLSVTALSSRSDGLSYAVGTSTGHTLLYDIRAARPFAVKDQGYGLPVKVVSWIDGGSRVSSEGMVMTSDKKVIKIWDKNTPSTNFVSITPANDLNDLHHIPGSGLLLTANEGIQMAAYYIPQLGPAPRWATFLENITEELEDQSTRSIYEDYKFLDRSELKKLGLDCLIGTSMLKPYMHGYFISLKLYDTVKLVANPSAYAEHREKLIQEKMNKIAETRIRAKKDVKVKVNKPLAEKILREEEKARRREERKRKKLAQAEEKTDELSEHAQIPTSTSLLNDPRFAAVFENPDFAIDETSREYALLNPSSVTQKGFGARVKTAVEDEEQESDKLSSDVLGDSSSEEDDSSDDNRTKLGRSDSRSVQRNGASSEAHKPARKNVRMKEVNLVPIWRQEAGTRDKHSTFGQQLNSVAKKQSTRNRSDMEFSWMPSPKVVDANDMLVSGGRHQNKKKVRSVETFGLEKGPLEQTSERDRKGRTDRRRGMRSGSKNAFRRVM